MQRNCETVKQIAKQRCRSSAILFPLIRIVTERRSFAERVRASRVRECKRENESCAHAHTRAHAEFPRSVYSQYSEPSADWLKAARSRSFLPRGLSLTRGRTVRRHSHAALCWCGRSEPSLAHEEDRKLALIEGNKKKSLKDKNMQGKRGRIERGKKERKKHVIEPCGEA